MADHGEGFLSYHPECPGMVSPTDLLYPHSPSRQTSYWILTPVIAAKHLLSPLVRRSRNYSTFLVHVNRSGQTGKMASERLTAPFVITAGAIWPPVCAIVVALRFYTRKA